MWPLQLYAVMSKKCPKQCAVRVDLLSCLVHALLFDVFVAVFVATVSYCDLIGHGAMTWKNLKCICI